MEHREPTSHQSNASRTAQTDQCRCRPRCCCRCPCHDQRDQPQRPPRERSPSRSGYRRTDWRTPFDDLLASFGIPPAPTQPYPPGEDLPFITITQGTVDISNRPGSRYVVVQITSETVSLDRVPPPPTSPLGQQFYEDLHNGYTRPEDGNREDGHASSGSGQRPPQGDLRNGNHSQ